MSDERREYFRVACQAMVQLKAMPGEAEAEALNAFRLGAGDAFTLATRFATATREAEALFKRIAAQSPDVAAYLSAIDHKLDTLARLLMSRDVQGAPSEVIEIELSATGLGCESDDSVPSGALAAVRMVLLPQYSGIEALGRVVHCKPLSNGRFWIGVNFEHIRDADRELIIQHVLERQSASLRDRQQLAVMG